MWEYAYPKKAIHYRELLEILAKTQQAQNYCTSDRKIA